MDKQYVSRAELVEALRAIEKDAFGYSYDCRDTVACAKHDAKAELAGELATKLEKAGAL